MPSILGDSATLLTLIAVMPAVISWWSGRRLLAIADDPVLPERMIANQRRNSFAFIIALAGLASISPRSLLWTCPLAFLSTYAAAYPTRRVVFGETWSVTAYLSFFARLVAGLFGFWAVLAGLPALARLAGSFDWIAGPVLAAALIVWNARYAEAVRCCLRTRPLDEGPLLDRCRRLADQCGMPQPRYEVISLQGGVVANALALPSLRGSSVLFTDTLLAKLEPQEAAAICAHELAHLEYYNPARLRQMSVVTHGLIAVGAAWTPLQRLVGLGGSTWPMVIWLGLLTAALLLRARGKQRQETVCDVRAVGLMGDPAPLVGALTKLYTIARIPRRIELQREQADTHPSLARRIKDIRKAAGAAPAQLERAAVVTGADGRTLVTFDQTLLCWTGADAVTRSIEYGNLSELRIDAARTRGPRLVARSIQSQTWEVALRREDIARVQSVLDQIDSRLGEAPAGPVIPRWFSRPAVGVVALIALMLGQVSVAFLTLLALVRLAAPLLAAAGVGALTAAALALRGSRTDLGIFMAVPVAVAGLILLLTAWAYRTQEHGRLRGPIAMVGVLTGLAVLSIAIVGLDAVRLHQAVRQTSSATILLAGLAGALGMSRSRASQMAGLAAALACAALAFAGSPAFLDRFGSDPFLVEAPEVRWLAVEDAILEQFAVPEATSQIRLSPDGRQIAALHQSESNEHSSTFLIGRAGQEFARIAGDDLLFLDDNHVLVAVADSEGTTLRKIPVSGQVPTWSIRIDDLTGSTMMVDPRTERWRLTGWDRSRALFRAEGAIGEAAFDGRRWPSTFTDESWVNAFTTTGSDALVVESRSYGGPLHGMLPGRWSWVALLLMPYSEESRFWTLTARERIEHGTSRFGTNCQAGVLAADALVCEVFDGTRTRLLSLSPTGEVRGLASIEGRFFSDGNAVPGWITGWAETTSVAIRLSTGHALRLEIREHAVGHLTVSGDRLAAITFGPDGTTVRTYAVDRVPSHEAKR